MLPSWRASSVLSDAPWNALLQWLRASQKRPIVLDGVRPYNLMPYQHCGLVLAVQDLGWCQCSNYRLHSGGYRESKIESLGLPQASRPGALRCAPLGRLLRTPFDSYHKPPSKRLVVACHERSPSVARTSRMVEAAGVEPASGKLPLKLLHAYPGF